MYYNDIANVSLIQESKSDLYLDDNITHEIKVLDSASHYFLIETSFAIKMEPVILSRGTAFITYVS